MAGQPGRVIAVAQRTLSASLAVDADAADTSLTVSDASVFDPDGGTAVINPDDSETPLTVTYTGIAGTVVALSAALGVNVVASSLVTPQPEVSLRVATVQLGGDESHGSVEAVIDTGPASHPLLSLGVLDVPVSVWVEDGGVAGLGFTVSRLLGHEPAVAGDTVEGEISADTLPQQIIDDIDAAGAAADAAQSTADDAAQDALDAANAAAVADGKADAAQSDATQALSDASDASDLAGSKGKVIIQSSAPAAADQLSQNLWIDTTGGANTPKRWDGDSWEAVTDKVAQDAAADAAAAQAAADAAAAAASTAQSTADGKSTVVYSGANASSPGTYAEGDTWFKFTGGLLVGQWRHDGSAWQTIQLDDAVIGNLDAAKITTGFLNVAVLIQAGAIAGDKIAADAIDGKTITGATIRTAASGQRVVNDADGVKLWTDAIVQLQAWPAVGPAYGVAANSQGRVYVALRIDGGSSYVYEYNADGSWSGWRLSDPVAATDMVVDASDNLYVLDGSSDLIYKYDANLNLVDSWSTTGEPHGLAIDSSGYLYVADWTNTRMRKYDSSSGTEVTGFAIDFNYAVGVAVDTAGNVYTANGVATVVRKYSPSGTLLESWPISASPTDIAIDADGYIYVSDGATGDILKLNSTGTLVDSWNVGEPAVPSGPSTPSDVFLDGEGDLYAVDNSRGAVRKYNTSQREVVAASIDAETRSIQGMNANFDGSLTVGELTARTFNLSPDVRSGTFSITFPSGTSNKGTRYVSFQPPLFDAPQLLIVHPIDPTYGNLALNCFEEGRDYQGFTWSGYRGGPATIDFTYTAVYFPRGYFHG